MISGFFRLTSLACCTLVVLSFAMFARDQAAGASAQQTQLVAGPSSAPAGSSPAPSSAIVAPGSPASRIGPVHHAQPRRFIDAAAKVLSAPFVAIVPSSNGWVKHGLPAVFALIVYGLGLGYLARYSAVRAG